MGVHRGILQAFKHMKNGGLVVNVSSTAGLTCIGDMMATPAYVTSKHAVTSLTRTFGVRGHPQIRIQITQKNNKFSYLLRLIYITIGTKFELLLWLLISLKRP